MTGIPSLLLVEIQTGGRCGMEYVPEQINVPKAPQTWQVQAGAAAGLLLCALLKVVGASRDYGYFLKALTVQFEK